MDICNLSRWIECQPRQGMCNSHSIIARVMGWSLLVFLGTTLAISSLFAAPKPDDDAPVPEGSVDELSKPQAKPAPNEPAADDEDRPSGVEAGATDDAAAEIDRLERVIAGMRNAQKRIAGTDTSPETQAVQEGVVKDLEALLEFLKRQQSRQNQSPSGQKQSKNKRQKPQKGGGDPQNSNAKPNPNPNDSQKGPRNDGKSSDSQEQADPAKAKAADDARRAQMVKDVWGHLPPHLRDAISKAFGENYLPKYDDLVKKYYEALAEKNRKQSGK